MPFEATLAIALAIIGASVVALIAVTASRRRAAQDDDMHQAASARGWQFETTTEHGFRVRRWRGTTDGVAWTAESLRSTQGANQRQRRRQMARWRTSSTIGVTTPIVCLGVPDGKDPAGLSMAEGTSWLAKLAQKAAGFALDKAIDAYFGDELGRSVDAAALKRVDGGDTPGFVIMAADVDTAARVLFQGLRAALADAGGDRGSVLSQADRLWILISPQGVALSSHQALPDINAVDGFVRAGVRLTRLPTFGRPSPS